MKEMTKSGRSRSLSPQNGFSFFGSGRAPPWRSLLQDIELMPQYHDLGFQLLSRLEAVAQHADEQEADCDHAAIMF